MVIILTLVGRRQRKRVDRGYKASYRRDRGRSGALLYDANTIYKPDICIYIQ